jgi:hypothetical protein
MQPSCPGSRDLNWTGKGLRKAHNWGISLHAKMSESITFIRTRDRKYTVNVQCSVEYTLLLLYLVGTVSLFLQAMEALREIRGIASSTLFLDPGTRSG